MACSGDGTDPSTLSSQTAPILPSGTYGQHFLGAHLPQSLQGNSVSSVDKKEYQQEGGQETWAPVLTLPPGN